MSNNFEQKEGNHFWVSNNISTRILQFVSPSKKKNAQIMSMKIRYVKFVCFFMNVFLISALQCSCAPMHQETINGPYWNFLLLNKKTFPKYYLSELDTHIKLVPKSSYSIG